MKRKIVMTAAVTSLVAASYLAVGNYFYDYALKARKKKVFLENNPQLAKSQAIDPQAEAAAREADLAFLMEHPPLEKYILSDDKRALKLHASFYQNDPSSHKYAVVIHGYTGKNELMIRWARGIFAKGFHVLTPDLRGHGTSEGDYIGMGWHDRLDVLTWIEDVIKHDAEAEILLFGLSMGAATVMMVSGEPLPDNVKLIIEDCGYSTVRGVFSYQLKSQFGVPDFPILNAANTIAKIRAGYDLFRASATKQVSKSTTPMLFIHGDADTFVPFEMIYDVYDAANVEKEKLIVAGAGHADAVKVDPELYWNTVWRFAERFFNL